MDKDISVEMGLQSRIIMSNVHEFERPEIIAGFVSKNSYDIVHHQFAISKSKIDTILHFGEVIDGLLRMVGKEGQVLRLFDT